MFEDLLLCVSKEIRGRNHTDQCLFRRRGRGVGRSSFSAANGGRLAGRLGGAFTADHGDDEVCAGGLSTMQGFSVGRIGRRDGRIIRAGSPCSTPGTNIQIQGRVPQYSVPRSVSTRLTMMPLL